MIEPRDERPHEHGGRAGWSERLSFNFFDATSGFGGIARVDHRPVEKRADGTISVFMPEGAIATVFAKEPIADAGGSSVARIHLDPYQEGSPVNGPRPASDTAQRHRSISS